MKRLVVATLLSLVPCGIAQAQQSLCITPFDYCPVEGISEGQFCDCVGDGGAVVTVNEDGYLLTNLPGNVCYTNFDPCWIDGALVGDECECGAVPGIVGIYQ